MLRSFKEGCRTLFEGVYKETYPKKVAVEQRTVASVFREHDRGHRDNRQASKKRPFRGISALCFSVDKSNRGWGGIDSQKRPFTRFHCLSIRPLLIWQCSHLPLLQIPHAPFKKAFEQGNLMKIVIKGFLVVFEEQHRDSQTVKYSFKVLFVEAFSPACLQAVRLYTKRHSILCPSGNPRFRYRDNP